MWHFIAPNLYCWFPKTLVAIHWMHPRVHLICVKSFAHQNSSMPFVMGRLVTSPATAKSKSPILKSKSTLNRQVQVPVQVLFKKGKSKSKSKSSKKKRTCKQFYPIPVLFLLLLLSKTLYRTQKKLILKYCYLQQRCHPYTVYKMNSFLHKYFIMLK